MRWPNYCPKASAAGTVAQPEASALTRCTVPTPTPTSRAGFKTPLPEARLAAIACSTGHGGEAALAIYPGGAHGFTLFPNDLSNSAQARMDTFLNRVLG